MQEFHLIPQDTKEHERSPECWCKPQASTTTDSITWVHDVARPEISEATDIEEVSAYFTKRTGQTPHADLLKAMFGSILRVVVAREGGDIVGMAAYSMVVNPFGGGVGYALLVDLSNGHKLEIPHD